MKANAFPALHDQGDDEADELSTVQIAVEVNGPLVSLSLADGGTQIELHISADSAKRLGNTLLDAASFSKMGQGARLQ